MSTDLSTNQNFQQKMMERIRASIGDLLPDEALKKIVEEGIKKAFFEKQQFSGSYGSRTVSESWLESFLRNELESKVRDAVNAWMIEHPDEVKNMLKSQLDAGVGMAIVNALSQLVNWPLQQFHREVAQKLGISSPY